MKHVLISGGSGLVGRYIAEECLAEGLKVTIGGRRKPDTSLFYKPVDFQPLFLDADRDQSPAFDGVNLFVHAAFSHEPGRYRGGEGNDPDGFIAQNRDGSIALFNAAKKAGVRRCIFISSRAVYDGAPDASELTEDRLLSPQSLYGQIKWDAEQALAMLAEPGFVPTSLRATGVYGDLRPNKWDTLFENYLAGNTITPRAASEVHGRDLARAVLTVAKAPVYKVSGKAFNVSDIVTDNHAILTPLKSTAMASTPLPMRADHDAVSVMSTARLNALGWRSGGMPLFDETLETLAKAFLRDHS